MTEFLKQLAVRREITHQSLDRLPRSRTRDYVRGLLVEHGILPRRDDLRVRYQEWVTEELTRLTYEANRDIIERYVRWQHLRRMNQMETVPHGTFLRSKQTVTVAINFVNLLHERGVTLEDLQQSDVDAWVAGGPTTRLIADRFLNWAIKNRIARSGLTIPKHRRGTSKKLSAADQETALTEVIDGGDLSSRDRAAAILILVFGQQIEDVVALTWEDVSVTDDLVTITLGGFAIELREPLDAHWRSLAANPDNNLTAAHPNSPWLLPRDDRAPREGIRRGIRPVRRRWHRRRPIRCVVSHGSLGRTNTTSVRPTNEQTSGCRGYTGGQPGSRTVSKEPKSLLHQP